MHNAQLQKTAVSNQLLVNRNDNLPIRLGAQTLGIFHMAKAARMVERDCVHD